MVFAINVSNRDNILIQSQSKQWARWAKKAQFGDKKAYTTLLRDIVPFIQSVLAGRLANQDWADDITQDILLSVHKSLHTYDPSRPFRPWLMSIITFRKTDYLRRYYRKRRHKSTGLDNPEFIEEHVTHSPHAGEWKDVQAQLQDLPDKQRKVIELMKIKGYTAKETAKKLDMSVSAVKVSAHRTMKKLTKAQGER